MPTGTISSKTKANLSVRSEAELAYIAGFFDGEGSVGVKSNGGIHFLISQKDITPLLQIQSWLGWGSVRPRSNGAYRYCLSGWSNVIPVLKALMPYLIVKQEKARQIIADREDLLHD